MGFTRCGFEGNLRNIRESTRKNFSVFYFFVILENENGFALFGDNKKVVILSPNTAMLFH